MQVKSESEVARSYPTLHDPMDCSLPGSSIHGIFPGKNTGVGCHCLLREREQDSVNSNETPPSSRVLDGRLRNRGKKSPISFVLFFFNCFVLFSQINLSN
ncbi:unnamed protein product [Rangifer tarandus platyrhynchus]|uniref:Uncharacterized protein n=2 Tax=Rangifer tarandus platyrhynchus TaxID=3082113 RepID=A0AC60A390_RANTA|nr:unnamed protein product [Rangifer tarandus platyrhynchus]